MTAALAPFLDNPKRVEPDKFGWQIKHHTGLIHQPVSETPHLEGYTEFAFVRNPFDIVVSIWRKLHESGIGRGGKRVEPFFKEEISFLEFCRGMMCPKYMQRWGIQHLFWTQSEYLETVPDSTREILCGKFENLPTSWDDMMYSIGLIDTPKLDRLNAGQTRKADYREYYCNETRYLVRERYWRDLRVYGYQF